MMILPRRSILRAAAGTALLVGGASTAFGQSRAETLRYVIGNNVNTLDPTMFGSTRESFGVSMNVYDRLFTFGGKQVGGNFVFDHTTICGESRRTTRSARKAW